MRLFILVVCLWLATNPLQGKIVFDSKRDGNSEIYTMNLDGSNQIRLTNNRAMDIAPTWSPNGQRIVFHSLRHGGATPEIYMMEADGKNLRRLTVHTAYDGHAHWHPDGNRIAFISSRGVADGLGIYTMDLNGKNIQFVIQAAFIGRVRWSSDGQRIAFTGEIGTDHSEIHIINADGTNRWQLPRSLPEASMGLGDWSPDGRKILYTEMVEPVDKNNGPNGTSLGIATLNRTQRGVVGNKEIQLPGFLWAVHAEGWGGDGKSILLSGRPMANWEIYRYRLSDGELTPLTDSPGTDYAAHEWNPRLSVSPQRLAPKRWGEIKSNSHSYRGMGGISITPIP